MKRAMFVLLAAFLTGMGGGCHHRHSCHFGECRGSDSEESCGEGEGGPQCGQQAEDPNAGPGPGYMQQGPPTAAVAYPYYTTRGPRDFLMNNPRTIGP